MTLVDPTASVEIVNFDLPPLSCAVPSTFVPTVKVTGPVGITVGEVIVAVNAGDLNKDGKPDVVTVNAIGLGLGVLLNNTTISKSSTYDGAFRFSALQIASGLLSRSPAFGYTRPNFKVELLL